MCLSSLIWSRSSAAFSNPSFLFERNLVVQYGCGMTATAVIEEIKHLPPGEQSRVLRFAFEFRAQPRIQRGQAVRLSEFASASLPK
jgi:hypothetical protein